MYHLERPMKPFELQLPFVKKLPIGVAGNRPVGALTIIPETMFQDYRHTYFFPSPLLPLRPKEIKTTRYINMKMYKDKIYKSLNMHSKRMDSKSWKITPLYSQLTFLLLHRHRECLVPIFNLLVTFFSHESSATWNT